MGLGPGFKASEGKGTGREQGTQSWSTGQTEQAGAGGSHACNRHERKRKEPSHFTPKSVEWRLRHVETCRYKTWGSSWIV